MAVVEGGTNLAELVAGLNALGIGPRDMIDILSAIKTAGALHAEFIVR
jgi:flagellar P-ring protein precursor FlgI